MFYYFRARKKKRLTFDESVKIIAFSGQALRERVEKPTPIKASISPQNVAPISQPAKQEKKILNAPTGEIKSDLVSIKSILNPKKEAKTNSTDIYGIREELPFMLDDLKMAWKRYAFHLKESGKDSHYSTLVKRDPKLVNDFEIHFELDNTLQEKSFATDKTEMLNFLRKELRNWKISLHTTVLEKDDQNNSKFLSNQDKFNVLVGKNKQLETLRRRFNLDIEY